MRVLIVEDDSATAQSMELMLKSEGFNCYTTDLGEEAIDLAKVYDYDIITLDLNLPDMNGLDVLRTLRTCKVTSPVIIVSGTSDVNAKVTCLEAGADDYLQKPFHKAELVARLHAIVRRANGHTESELHVGRLKINLAAKTVTTDAGACIWLTGKEYQMMELLALRKGTTLTKEMFLNHLYGGMDEPELRIIDVFICKLRRKIRDALGVGENYIETVWGRGYCLREQPVAVKAIANDDTRPLIDHLTSPRGQILVELATKGQLTSAILAESTGFAVESIGGSLNKLFRRDLVSRTLIPNGRNGCYRYQINDKGKEWLKDAGYKPMAAAS